MKKVNIITVQQISCGGRWCRKYVEFVGKASKEMNKKQDWRLKQWRWSNEEDDGRLVDIYVVFNLKLVIFRLDLCSFIVFDFTKILEFCFDFTRDFGDLI